MKTTRTYRIEDSNGRFYLGEGHWGQRQQAEEYTDTSALPSYLDGPNGETLEKEIFMATPVECDIRYYSEDDQDGHGVATVRMTVEDAFDEEENEF